MILDIHYPFDDENPIGDNYFEVVPGRGIVHYCEEQVGGTWNADEAREAARRLLVMADMLETERDGNQ